MDRVCGRPLRCGFSPTRHVALPNPLLLDGAYGMPSMIEDDDDDSSEEDERDEPWVVDSGATFHILSEDEVAAWGTLKYHSHRL